MAATIGMAVGSVSVAIRSTASTRLTGGSLPQAPEVRDE
jgi:hypothetical protein